MAQLSITDFGAVGNGSTNNQTAIQNCLNQAAAGHSVFIPPGTFNHSGMLTMPQGCLGILGAGETAILKATTYGQEALRIVGDDFFLHDFQLRGHGGARLSTPASQKIWLDDVDGFEIYNLWIRLTTTGGCFIQGSSNGYVHHNLIEDTHADSIHCVHGNSVSHDIDVAHNTIRRSGDDGVACVSGTGPTGARNYNLTFRNNDIRFNTAGRGIGVIGGLDIFVTNNVIHGGTQQSGSGGAGIIVASESAYNTPGNNRVCVSGNLLVDCGSSQNNPGHHSIHISSSVSGQINDNIRVANNTIQNPRRGGIGLTGGAEININHYNNTFINPTSWGNFVNSNTNGNTTVSTTPVTGCPPPALGGFEAQWACGINQLIP